MATELDVQRRNTKAFIAAHSASVVLIPRVPQKTGTGIKLVDQPARAAQTVRLIDQSAPGGPTPGTVRAADGAQRKVEFILLGTWDAVFGLYDYWIASGIRHEVADLLPYNDYERRALVVRYGEG